MFTLDQLIKEAEPVAKNDRAEEAIRKAQQLKELGMKAAAEEIMKKAQVAAKMNRLAGHRYVAITPEKIQAHLNRLAAAYNARHQETAKKKAEEQLKFLHEPGLFGGWLKVSKKDMKKAIELDLGEALQSIPVPTGNPYADIDTSTNALWTSTGTTVVENIDWTAYRDAIFGESPLYALATVSPSISRGSENFEARTIHASASKPGTIGRFVWHEVPVKDYKNIPPDHALKALKEHSGRKVFDYFTIASVENVKDPLLLGRLDGVTDRYYLAQWGDDVKLDDVI